MSNILPFKKKAVKKPEVKTDEYFIQLAVEAFGAGIRDNTRSEKIMLGKAIENGTIDEDEE